MSDGREMLGFFGRLEIGEQLFNQVVNLGSVFDRKSENFAGDFQCSPETQVGFSHVAFSIG